MAEVDQGIESKGQGGGQVGPLESSPAWWSAISTSRRSDRTFPGSYASALRLGGQYLKPGSPLQQLPLPVAPVRNSPVQAKRASPPKWIPPQPPRA